MAAARSIDWEVVHLEFRANVLSIRQIAEEAMKIAASICIYTNGTFTIEEL